MWEEFRRFWYRVCNCLPGEMRCPNGIIKLHTLLTMTVFDEKGNFVQEQSVRDRKITNQFVNLLVDKMQTTDTNAENYLEDFKYHYCGSGTDAEGATDTGLIAGTTESGYVVGSQTESTDGENYYKSIATITITTTSTGLDICEHGLFNTTSSTSGIMMDRTLFTSLVVKNAWKIEFTFEASFTAGG